MAFTLPPLPYGYDALEPYIDARTMEIHHDKHHAGYVNNLNAALEKAPELQSRSLDDLLQHLDQVPEAIRTAVRNNAGGHWNHTMFWQIMTPNGGGTPAGRLADAVNRAFGSFDAFRTQFADAAAKRFGSGWAWLVSDGGALSITSTPNQDTPVMEGKHPIMGVDVWEHAYYLKYQNRRPEYVTQWWNTLNWDEIGRRYEAAAGKES